MRHAPVRYARQLLTVGIASLVWTTAIESTLAVQNSSTPNQNQQNVQLDSNKATSYYQQGNELYRQGKLAEAIATYRKAIELNAEYVEAYVGLGNALDDSGETEKAIAAYQQAIRL